MGVQFGRWNCDGKPIDQDYLEKVQPLLLPYGPDDRGSYSSGALSMLYCAFHTTRESRHETQPHVSPSGAVVTWDGRLDNRAELISELHQTTAVHSTDVEIVAAAYEHYGSSCFAKLIGDWALAIWDPLACSLTLAKDPVGVRHLYYSLDDNQVTWSTILDPLVLFAEKTLSLCEEYVAGWFSHFPATQLTPYVGVHAVPPSSLVLIRDGKAAVRKYWDFDPHKRIRYRWDKEYEEHFRTLFAHAVCRRLRSDSPILAELSGGMDSSSIVCMADKLISEEKAEAPRLDTISYYDDSEPNWNDRPYFTKVEQARGRAGCHIDLSQQGFSFNFDNGHFAATPASCRNPNEVTGQIAACIAEQGNRVVLSGIGGDEVMGGVPTPMPQLEDLLAGAKFRQLAHQLKVWAIEKRKPWFYLLFEAGRGFFPPALLGIPQHKRPAFWLNQTFVKRNRMALHGYGPRLKLFGPLPTFQENVSTLDILRRQLACSALSSGPVKETRYPYLDRDLLEFIYAIPREQLVRPGQRRSLMRRALVGIVPDELLNRKRKAFVSRSPIAAICSQWTQLRALPRHMVMCSLGIIDPQKFHEALEKARQGQEIAVGTLMRTVSIELWLKNLTASRILVGSRNNRNNSAPSADLLSQLRQI
jgi:asparagine synthase (glutamine-hydrolysing)